MAAAPPLQLSEAELRRVGEGSPAAAGMGTLRYPPRDMRAELPLGKEGSLYLMVIDAKLRVLEEEEEQNEHSALQAGLVDHVPRYDEEVRADEAVGSGDGPGEDAGAGAGAGAGVGTKDGASAAGAPRRSWTMYAMAVAGVVALLTAVVVGRPTRLVTHDELARRAATQHNDEVWIAILGSVYDVSSSKRLYGYGGSYSFFAGIDATRAFGTGTFSRSGLVPDTTGLQPVQLLELDRWANFYRTGKYRKVGHLVGAFYTAQGRPTRLLQQTWARIRVAKQAEKDMASLSQEFPACNSRWATGEPRQVWCSSNSGGVERAWVGVPRLMRKGFDSDLQCVCVAAKDLEDPRLRKFRGCRPEASRCLLSDHGTAG